MGVFFQNFLKKFFVNKKPPISLVIEVNRRRVELFMFLVYAGRIIHVFGVYWCIIEKDKFEFVEYLYYRITDYKTDELQGRRFEKI